MHLLIRDRWFVLWNSVDILRSYTHIRVTSTSERCKVFICPSYLLPQLACRRVGSARCVVVVDRRKWRKRKSQAERSWSNEKGGNDSGVGFAQVIVRARWLGSCLLSFHFLGSSKRLSSTGFVMRISRPPELLR